MPDPYPAALDPMGFAGDIPAGDEGVSQAKPMKTGEGVRPASQVHISSGRSDPARGSRGVRTRRHTLRIDHGERYPGYRAVVVTQDAAAYAAHRSRRERRGDGHVT